MKIAARSAGGLLLLVCLGTVVGQAQISNFQHVVHHVARTGAENRAGRGGIAVFGWRLSYRLAKNSGKWVETVLHLFNNHPLAGVTFDSGGNIYGTTARTEKPHTTSTDTWSLILRATSMGL
jgi:hypothetical protein